MTADPARAAAIYLWLVSALVSGGPPIWATRIWLAWQRIHPTGSPVPGMPRITATLAGLAVKAAAHARNVPANSHQALQRASTVLTRWLLPPAITASALVSGDPTNSAWTQSPRPSDRRSGRESNDPGTRTRAPGTEPWPTAWKIAGPARKPRNQDQ